MLYFRKQLAVSTSDDQRAVWIREIGLIEDWLASPRFKRGEYARGIDDLLLELIEWRAVKYAFQNVETENSPFRDHIFYSQWLIGGTYAVFALLGQLVSSHELDKSLRKLWREVSPFMARDGACTVEEVEFINQRMCGHFTNECSKALMFRNKAIAHNEWCPRIEWTEIDKDLEILVRVWSLIVSWSSFGRFDPFRTSDQVFSGLESFFNTDELNRLKTKRQEYLARVFQWAITYLHNGQRDPGRGGFSKLSVTSSVVLTL